MPIKYIKLRCQLNEALKEINMKYKLDLLQQKYENLQKKLWIANKELIELKAKIARDEERTINIVNDITAERLRKSK